MPPKKKPSLKERLKFAKPKLSPTQPHRSPDQNQRHTRHAKVTNSGAWVYEDVKIKAGGLMLEPEEDIGESFQDDIFPPRAATHSKSTCLLEKEKSQEQREKKRRYRSKALKKIRLDDLKFLDDVGSGASASVKKAVHKASNISLALKIIPLGKKDVKPKVIVSEIKTLFEAQHANIVQIYEAFHKNGWIYVALEYMDLGSLKDVLDTYKKNFEEEHLPEIVIADVFLKVVEGLNHLHQHCNVIHRDIKPENILINTEGEVKLSDFGMAAKLKEQNKRDTFQGTMVYMSPERLRGDVHSYSSDIWSLGLTMAMCAVGRFPLETGSSGSNDQKGPSFFDLLEKVTTVEQVPLDQTQVSQELSQVIWACTKQNPDDRPSTIDLLQMEFFKRHKERDFQLDQWLINSVFSKQS